MKYLKRYNELNEGLRDKMKPKSEEDIFKTLKHLDLNQLKQKFLQMWLQYNFQHRVDNKAFSNYVHSIIGRDLWEEKKQKYIDGGLKDLRYLEFNMKFSVSPEILLYDAELSKEELIKLIISSYSELNEGLRDKMTSVSNDEMIKSILKSPDDSINKIIHYELDDMIDIVLKQDLSKSSKNKILKYASSKNKLEIVKHLLKDDEVDPNASDGVPLNFACKYGYIEIVKELIKRPDIKLDIHNNTPIKWSCLEGHTEIVKILLGYDEVNPFENEVIFLSTLSYGHFDIIDLLINYIKEKDVDQDILDYITNEVLYTTHTDIGVQLINTGARFAVNHILIEKGFTVEDLLINLLGEKYNVEVLAVEKIVTKNYYTLKITK